MSTPVLVIFLAVLAISQLVLAFSLRRIWLYLRVPERRAKPRGESGEDPFITPITEKRRRRPNGSGRADDTGLHMLRQSLAELKALQKDEDGAAPA